jgi:tetratricopeptide (TPR) repeat protein
MVGLTVAQVRAWVRSGLLEPARGPRGELKFSPEDLALLRAARGLAGARIGPRRIERALSRLREQGSLEDLEILAEGKHIVVTDGSARWQPESGQILMDFSETGGECVPLARPSRRASPGATGNDQSAVAWYERGCALEASDAGAAEDAYRRAIEVDPAFADAYVNLGRLRHEAGDAAEAESHYRQALDVRPDDATAAFDLGVALEDLGRDLEAIETYERAVELDPGHADAYFNLAGACERAGRAAAAIRYLKAYRALTRSRSQ